MDPQHYIVSSSLRVAINQRAWRHSFTAASHRGSNPGQDFPIRVWATEKLPNGTYGLNDISDDTDVPTKRHWSRSAVARESRGNVHHAHLLMQCWTTRGTVTALRHRSAWLLVSQGGGMPAARANGRRARARRRVQRVSRCNKLLDGLLPVTGW